MNTDIMSKLLETGDELLSMGTSSDKHTRWLRVKAILDKATQGSDYIYVEPREGKAAELILHYRRVTPGDGSLRGLVKGKISPI